MLEGGGWRVEGGGLKVGFSRVCSGWLAGWLFGIYYESMRKENSKEG